LVVDQSALSSGSGIDDESIINTISRRRRRRRPTGGLQEGDTAGAAPSARSSERHLLICGCSGFVCSVAR